MNNIRKVGGITVFHKGREQFVLAAFELADSIGNVKGKASLLE